MSLKNERANSDKSESKKTKIYQKPRLKKYKPMQKVIASAIGILEI